MRLATPAATTAWLAIMGTGVGTIQAFQQQQWQRPLTMPRVLYRASSPNAAAVVARQALVLDTDFDDFDDEDEEYELDEDGDFSQLLLRQAYDTWRVQFGKGDFDEQRFQNFQFNYLALMQANAMAKKRAQDLRRPEPTPRQLNEYGDYSPEEFKALQRQQVKQNRFMNRAANPPPAAEIPTISNANSNKPTLFFVGPSAIIDNHDAPLLDLDWDRFQNEISSSKADRVRNAYRDFCKLYGKQFNEARMAIFGAHLRQIERYSSTPAGGWVAINEHADLTLEDYKSLQTGIVVSPSPSKIVEKDKTKQVYGQWCKYYEKDYDETRLEAFRINLRQIQQFYRKTGQAVNLNEFADLTAAEYKAMVKSKKLLVEQPLVEEEEWEEEDDEELSLVVRKPKPVVVIKPTKATPKPAKTVVGGKHKASPEPSVTTSVPTPKAKLKAASTGTASSTFSMPTAKQVPPKKKTLAMEKDEDLSAEPITLRDIESMYLAAASPRTTVDKKGWQAQAPTQARQQSQEQEQARQQQQLEEEEARMLALEEAQKRAEEQIQKLEAKARELAEAEEKLKREQERLEARRKAKEEEDRRNAQEEARIKSEVQRRLEAFAEKSKVKAKEIAQKKAAQEARLRAFARAKQQAEETQRLQGLRVDQQYQSFSETEQKQLSDPQPLQVETVIPAAGPIRPEETKVKYEEVEAKLNVVYSAEALLEEQRKVEEAEAAKIAAMKKARFDQEQKQRSHQAKLEAINRKREEDKSKRIEEARIKAEEALLEEAKRKAQEKERAPESTSDPTRSIDSVVTSNSWSSFFNGGTQQNPMENDDIGTNVVSANSLSSFFQGSVKSREESRAEGSPLDSISAAGIEAIPSLEAIDYIVGETGRGKQSDTMSPLPSFGSFSGFKSSDEDSKLGSRAASSLNDRPENSMRTNAKFTSIKVDATEKSYKSKTFEPATSSWPLSADGALIGSNSAETPQNPMSPFSKEETNDVSSPFAAFPKSTSAGSSPFGSYTPPPKTSEKSAVNQSDDKLLANSTKPASFGSSPFGPYTPPMKAVTETGSMSGDFNMSTTSTMSPLRNPSAPLPFGSYASPATTGSAPADLQSDAWSDPSETTKPSAFAEEGGKKITGSDRLEKSTTTNESGGLTSSPVGLFGAGPGTFQDDMKPMAEEPIISASSPFGSFGVQFSPSRLMNKRQNISSTGSSADEPIKTSPPSPFGSFGSPSRLLNETQNISLTGLSAEEPIQTSFPSSFGSFGAGSKPTDITMSNGESTQEASVSNESATEQTLVGLSVFNSTIATKSDERTGASEFENRTSISSQSSPFGSFESSTKSMAKMSSLAEFPKSTSSPPGASGSFGLPPPQAANSTTTGEKVAEEASASNEIVTEPASSVGLPKSTSSFSPFGPFKSTVTPGAEGISETNEFDRRTSSTTQPSPFGSFGSPSKLVNESQNISLRGSSAFGSFEDFTTTLGNPGTNNDKTSDLSTQKSPPFSKKSFAPLSTGGGVVSGKKLEEKRSLGNTDTPPFGDSTPFSTSSSPFGSPKALWKSPANGTITGDQSDTKSKSEAGLGVLATSSTVSEPNTNVTETSSHPLPSIAGSDVIESLKSIQERPMAGAEVFIEHALPQNLYIEAKSANAYSMPRSATEEERARKRRLEQWARRAELRTQPDRKSKANDDMSLESFREDIQDKVFLEQSGKHWQIANFEEKLLEDKRRRREANEAQRERELKEELQQVEDEILRSRSYLQDMLRLAIYDDSSRQVEKEEKEKTAKARRLEEAEERREEEARRLREIAKRQADERAVIDRQEQANKRLIESYRKESSQMPGREIVSSPVNFELEQTKKQRVVADIEEKRRRAELDRKARNEKILDEQRLGKRAERRAAESKELLEIAKRQAKERLELKLGENAKIKAMTNEESRNISSSARNEDGSSGQDQNELEQAKKLRMLDDLDEERIKEAKLRETAVQHKIEQQRQQENALAERKERDAQLTFKLLQRNDLEENEQQVAKKKQQEAVKVSGQRTKEIKRREAEEKSLQEIAASQARERAELKYQEDERKRVKEDQRLSSLDLAAGDLPRSTDPELDGIELEQAKKLRFLVELDEQRINGEKNLREELAAKLEKAQSVESAIVDLEERKARLVFNDFQRKALEEDDQRDREMSKEAVAIQERAIKDDRRRRAEVRWLREIAKRQAEERAELEELEKAKRLKLVNMQAENTGVDSKDEGVSNSEEEDLNRIELEMANKLRMLDDLDERRRNVERKRQEEIEARRKEEQTKELTMVEMKERKSLSSFQNELLGRPRKEENKRSTDNGQDAVDSPDRILVIDFTANLKNKQQATTPRKSKATQPAPMMTSIMNSLRNGFKSNSVKVEDNVEIGMREQRKQEIAKLKQVAEEERRQRALKVAKDNERYLEESSKMESEKSSKLNLLDAALQRKQNSDPELGQGTAGDTMASSPGSLVQAASNRMKLGDDQVLIEMREQRKQEIAKLKQEAEEERRQRALKVAKDNERFLEESSKMESEKSSKLNLLDAALQRKQNSDPELGQGTAGDTMASSPGSLVQAASNRMKSGDDQVLIEMREQRKQEIAKLKQEAEEERRQRALKVAKDDERFLEESSKMESEKSSKLNLLDAALQRKQNSDPELGQGTAGDTMASSPGSLVQAASNMMKSGDDQVLIEMREPRKQEIAKLKQEAEEERRQRALKVAKDNERFLEESSKMESEKSSKLNLLDAALQRKQNSDPELGQGTAGDTMASSPGSLVQAASNMMKSGDDQVLIEMREPRKQEIAKLKQEAEEERRQRALKVAKDNERFLEESSKMESEKSSKLNLLDAALQRKQNSDPELGQGTAGDTMASSPGSLVQAASSRMKSGDDQVLIEMREQRKQEIAKLKQEAEEERRQRALKVAKDNERFLEESSKMESEKSSKLNLLDAALQRKQNSDPELGQGTAGDTMASSPGSLVQAASNMMKSGDDQVLIEMREPRKQEIAKLKQEAEEERRQRALKVAKDNERFLEESSKMESEKSSKLNLLDAALQRKQNSDPELGQGKAGDTMASSPGSLVQAASSRMKSGDDQVLIEMREQRKQEIAKLKQEAEEERRQRALKVAKDNERFLEESSKMESEKSSKLNLLDAALQRKQNSDPELGQGTAGDTMASSPGSLVQAASNMMKSGDDQVLIEMREPRKQEIAKLKQEAEEERRQRALKVAKDNERFLEESSKMESEKSSKLNLLDAALQRKQNSDPELGQGKAGDTMASSPGSLVQAASNMMKSGDDQFLIEMREQRKQEIAKLKQEAEEERRQRALKVAKDNERFLEESSKMESEKSSKLNLLDAALQRKQNSDPELGQGTAGDTMASSPGSLVQAASNRMKSGDDQVLIEMREQRKQEIAKLMEATETTSRLSLGTIKSFVSPVRRIPPPVKKIEGEQQVGGVVPKQTQRVERTSLMKSSRNSTAFNSTKKSAEARKSKTIVTDGSLMEKISNFFLGFSPAAAKTGTDPKSIGQTTEAASLERIAKEEAANRANSEIDDLKILQKTFGTAPKELQAMASDRKGDGLTSLLGKNTWKKPSPKETKPVSVVADGMDELYFLDLDLFFLERTDEPNGRTDATSSPSFLPKDIPSSPSRGKKEKTPRRSDRTPIGRAQAGPSSAAVPTIKDVSSARQSLESHHDTNGEAKNILESNISNVATSGINTSLQSMQKSEPSSTTLTEMPKKLGNMSSKTANVERAETIPKSESGNLFSMFASLGSLQGRQTSGKKAVESDNKSKGATQAEEAPVAALSRWWQQSDRRVTGFKDGVRFTTPPLPKGVKPTAGEIVEAEDGSFYRLL